MLKGFKQKKKLTRNQKDREEQATKFIKEYTELCKKLGLQFDIEYRFGRKEGLVAQFVIIEHKPEPEYETKDWDECKKENAKIRAEEEAKKNNEQ